MADDPTPQQPTEPTAKDYEDMQAVSAAGASARAKGEDPAEAMKNERDDRGFVKLDDETIDKLAKQLNQLNIESFREAGAFDPPPAPPSPPEQPVAPPAPAETPAEQAAAAPPQQKRTPAHRFLGIP